MNDENIIHVENVTKKFGHKKALKGISFSLKKGETLGLFGPNGAGKTTLLKILSTLSKPSSGNIKIAGFTPHEHEQELRKSIGIISHESFIYSNLTAWENLIFYSNLYDVKDSEARIERLLTDLGLFERRNDLARTFSRGMQQRLTIARALLHNPEIIFLDEPYTGLDQHATQLLSNLLAGLYKEKRTIILITHDLSLGFKISSHIAILCSGELVFFEKKDNIKEEDFLQVYHKKVGEK
ncbi:MAG: heme ABC exporter ATP-binding protein CcmA [Candidatus Firestonebacteria bacterium]|nr:heme ABC exporter ATP-binding protein CcmA [Candidatus Firestonebacteria bacterium]